jgi:transposase
VHLKAQLIRELDRLEVVLEQLKTVEAERDALLKPATDEAVSPAALLTRLKGIGPETAAVLWSEGLFRQFDNRRQVAAYAGLAPTPWQSGSIDHEQGGCLQKPRDFGGFVIRWAGSALGGGDAGAAWVFRC